MNENDPINYLLSCSLGIKNQEPIALLSDQNHSDIAQRIALFCEENNIPISKFIFNYTYGDSLNGEVKSLFLDDSPKVIILALNGNIWHTPERKKAKYKMGKRIANILHPGEPCGSYLADINNMNNVGAKIEHLFKQSKKIRISTDAGTDVTAQIGQIFCETGDYISSGSGGDFPPGEVGCGPIENSINGRIVYDFKIQHVGFVKENPHVIDIKNDHVEVVNGSQEFKNLLASHDVFKFLSEISIGINPIWTEVEDPSSIVEEKNLGTVHFGSGGNLSYGNRKGPHFDSVILNPTVYLDDTLIMKDGELKIVI